MTDKYTFWYHPESNSFWRKLDGEPVDELSVEVDEADWNRNYIQACIENRQLPDGCIALLLNATKNILGSDSYTLKGEIWLYKGLPDGHTIYTTLVSSSEPGGFYSTYAKKKYLVQLADIDNKTVGSNG